MTGNRSGRNRPQGVVRVNWGDFESTAPVFQAIAEGHAEERTFISRIATPLSRRPHTQYCCQGHPDQPISAGRQLHDQRGGHFIQFSSSGGRVGGTPGMGTYQSAKFAVEGFSEVLNADVKPLRLKVTIIEPGGFRTDWSDSSMLTSPVGDDYESTVGELNGYRESMMATWAGDPKRAAQIIVDIVDLDDPPLRLLLGVGAVESAANSSRIRAEEAERWSAVSRSADFAADPVAVASV